MTDPTAPRPDFTSPIAGRIEVRDPCPWCSDRPMVPRSLMDEHVAQMHPEVQTVEPPVSRAAVLREAADEAERVAESLRAHHEFERSTGALDVMTELRRMADEAQPDDTVHTCPGRWGGPHCRCFDTDEAQPGADRRDDYEFTTGHLITCFAKTGGSRDPNCPCSTAQPGTEAHSCSNCEGVDPATCLMNPKRQDGARS